MSALRPDPDFRAVLAIVFVLVVWLMLAIGFLAVRAVSS